MAATWANWLLNNIGRACRWRGNTTQFTDGCGNHFDAPCSAGGHGCEGGVDVPLAAGTPIYSLAGGMLIGNGPWRGHGVITQQVPGVGKLYYQHLDVLPSFPQCKSGNCPNVFIPAGTLLGYSNADVGEVEVGVNPAWGGIWGPPTSGTGWLDDPRQVLISLANGGVGSNQTTTTCKSPDDGSCKVCAGGVGGCPTDEQCDIFNSDGSVSPAPNNVPGVCVSNAYASSHTPSGIINPGNILNLPGWLTNPDWKRVLKVVGGVIGLAVGVLALFWPQVQGVAEQVLKVAA